jgi:SRSO17 transposase
VLGRVSGRFGRVETRRRFAGLLRGMVADLPRKNCWTIAEHAGDPTPYGMQHLLNRARWDTDGIAADLRDYVVDHLGEPDAILVVDETGDLKKGECTVAVQRQYTGTAGRIENAQVAVYLAYTSRTGHALIDRALYLPRCWAEDPDRRAAAGVPDEVDFATKPALAATMVARAVAAGVPARWASGDEVYGADPDLRACLEELGLVLAIGCNRQVRTHGGPMRAHRIADALPEHCWQRLSAGAGAKGARIYQWAFITLDTNTNTDTDQAGGYRWLLICRHPDTGELAYYRCWSPTPVPLGELVRVAGARWSIEEAFQASKTLSGLDEHQVRRWTPWRRWTLVSMLGQALLAVLAATEHIGAQDAGLIPLTCHEIARLLNRMRVRARPLANPLTWAFWRRRHQQRARTSHYRRRPAA